MAHELGHYVFHLHLIGSGVDDNRAYRSTGSGGYFNRNIAAREESEANRFAASVLMPEDLIQRLREKNTAEKMAKMFQVSTQAINIRLSGLPERAPAG